MSEMTRPIGPEDTFSQGDRLVDSLQAGDEWAFAEAFHLYKDMVYSLAYKLLTNKAEALDVTQEVFLTVFKKIGSFRAECSLKTWIYRVTISHAASQNRWWKRRLWNRTTSLDLGLQSESGIRPLQLGGPNRSAARECYSKEMRIALSESFKQLSFEQRVAVALRDLEGLTYEEIAEVTSVSIGTVKSRIARGREKLRDLLKDFRGGESL
jgi:RNA polymerase sigma-70 factor (ECF subfamily)